MVKASKAPKDFKEVGAPSPNYTQSPNWFYDKILPKIDSLVELKVTDVIIRNTFGWGRKDYEMTISRLMVLTGLSRKGAFDGIHRGMERGTIARRPNDKGTGFFYRLRMVEEVDQELETASPALYDGAYESAEVTKNGMHRRITPNATTDNAIIDSHATTNNVACTVGKRSIKESIKQNKQRNIKETAASSGNGTAIKPASNGSQVKASPEPVRLTPKQQAEWIALTEGGMPDAEALDAVLGLRIEHLAGSLDRP